MAEFMRCQFVGALIRFATNELDYNPLVDECSRVSDARGDILAGLEQAPGRLGASAIFMHGNLGGRYLGIRIGGDAIGHDPAVRNSFALGPRTALGAHRLSRVVCTITSARGPDVVGLERVCSEVVSVVS